VALLAGRLLLATLFLVFAARYAETFAVTAAGFARMGLPQPYVMVGLAIAIQAVAGLMLALGWRARGAAWALLAYVLAATLIAHRFWEYDPAYAANQMAHFFKNLALAGALLVIGSVGPGRYSIGKS
jgi:putative oxidoreductase